MHRHKEVRRRGSRVFFFRVDGRKESQDSTSMMGPNPNLRSGSMHGFVKFMLGISDASFFRY